MKRLAVVLLLVILPACAGSTPETMTTRTEVVKCPSRVPKLAPIETPPPYEKIEGLLRSHARCVATVKKCQANEASWRRSWGGCPDGGATGK